MRGEQACLNDGGDIEDFIIADFPFLLQVFAWEIFHISQLFLLDSWASSSH